MAAPVHVPGLGVLPKKTVSGPIRFIDHITDYINILYYRDYIVLTGLGTRGVTLCTRKSTRHHRGGGKEHRR